MHCSGQCRAVQGIEGPCRAVLGSVGQCRAMLGNVGQCSAVHYVFRSIMALHSFRLKMCSVNYIMQC